jgi:hypothetical protein
MSLGGQTVVFVTFTLGARGELGTRVETPVETPVPGCHFRTMTAKEITEGGFEAGLQLWKLTAPYNDTTTAIDDNGYLTWGGNTFAVIGGPKQHPDLDGGRGEPAHVTIYAQKAS